MFEHLDLNALIAAYGYWVIFLGCLLEGETVLILGGMAAHQGALQLLQVIGLATLGGMLGDQLLFWTGRYSGSVCCPSSSVTNLPLSGSRVLSSVTPRPRYSLFAFSTACAWWGLW